MTGRPEAGGYRKRDDRSGRRVREDPACSPCLGNRSPGERVGRAARRRANRRKAGRSVSQFFGTHQNRLDAKGRVSVPAPFRATLRALSGSEAPASIVLRPSHNHPCIEAWPPTLFQSLADSLDRLDLFGADHDDMAAALYADAFPVEADKEGRIILADFLLQHAGISGGVVFMGLGRTFQIWEPAAAEERRARARERARERGLTLPGAGVRQA
jgi:MraZ protein